MHTALEFCNGKPLERARLYSKAPVPRLAAFQDMLRRADQLGLSGDVVECGVWKGGHIILARQLSPQRHCWLYDTFAGMPSPGPHDVRRSGGNSKRMTGKTAASLEAVIDHLKAENVYDESKLTFVKGLVEDTLMVPEHVPQQIAMLRLDTDWYESTKIELEVLYPRLVNGGFLLIDDYGHWRGCRKAVDDYFQGKADLRFIDYTAVSLQKG
jgi:O-methyltransferase